jgi:hypothetical protein
MSVCVGMKIGPIQLIDSHTSYLFLTTSRRNLRKCVQFAVETLLSRVTLPIITLHLGVETVSNSALCVYDRYFM